jgi:rRNA-processing protein FCF1
VRVVLDTNALMMPVECDVRLFEGLEELLGNVECLVPEAVIDELEELSGSASEEARAADVGRDLADRCETIETDQAYADDAVLEAGLRETVAHVVTNDEALQERLIDAGVSVIRLRGQHKLAITQP